MTMQRHISIPGSNILSAHACHLPLHAQPTPAAEQLRATVMVVTLPDGSEILLRETPSGWSETPNGQRHDAQATAARPLDRTLLQDIAAAFGHGPAAFAATRGTAPDGQTEALRPRSKQVYSH